MISPVIQEETTGCGIASVANIVGKTYPEMKAIANSLGIYADDTALWSDTQYVRTLLKNEGIATSDSETPFTTWDALPDTALLAIKHHQEDGKDFWHWVVFRRIDGNAMVIDSAAYLDSNIRVDFFEMEPKWFIGVG
ncbi:hypothetical protein [Marinomonas atlantica]|uniref:hypothetical protein n=1 Tax=Marinomonas atlantica TaxID=1806668 RepID=UPI00082F93B1|nr:hypothetical protein [Marinomonas atlantica]